MSHGKNSALEAARASELEVVFQPGTVYEGYAYLTC